MNLLIPGTANTAGPIGLATPDYATPQKGDLLWVYEGMTQYWGDVLAARSALWTPEILPRGAGLERRPARRETRAHLAQPRRHRHRRPDSPWRPRVLEQLEAQPGLLPEGELIWLDADTTIRQLTHDQKSLNDFCVKFLAVGGNTPPKVVPYDFDEIVTDLNSVAPYDWRAFLTERLNIARRPRAAGWNRARRLPAYVCHRADRVRAGLLDQDQADRRVVLGWSHGETTGTLAMSGWIRLPFRLGWPGNQAGGGQRPWLHRATY